PALGLGTWQAFDVGEPAGRGPQREVLRRFVELGGRVVDTSPMYGAAEAAVGDLAAELGVRDSLWIATKVWTTGRAAGIAQMERSLQLLRGKRLDLLQIHYLVDWQTHLATLRDWKDAGRIRYLGVTHYSAAGHDALERVRRSDPADFAPRIWRSRFLRFVMRSFICSDSRVDRDGRLDGGRAAGVADGA